MPQTKKITLPAEFHTIEGSATLKVSVPNLKTTDVRFHLNVDSKPHISSFFDRPLEGELMVQEYWEEISKKFYFDVNSEGELIVIFPEGFDGYVNSEGELIIVEQ